MLLWLLPLPPPPTRALPPLALRCAGKRVAETLCMDYHREHGLEVRIVRIFNTYGPRMALDDGRVVSNFVAQALTNKPITVYGDGQQTRSFQFVSDLVRGLVAVMDGPSTGPYNIGNPGEFTMLELASKCPAQLGATTVRALLLSACMHACVVQAHVGVHCAPSMRASGPGRGGLGPERCSSIRSLASSIHTGSVSSHALPLQLQLRLHARGGALKGLCISAWLSERASGALHAPVHHVLRGCCMAPACCRPGQGGGQPQRGD